MVIGLLIALASPSAAISYVIALISGIFAGRLIYEKKESIRFPYLMIMGGFIVGYLVGIYYGSRKIVVALFVIGAIAGYLLYEKKILRDTKF